MNESAAAADAPEPGLAIHLDDAPAAEHPAGDGHKPIAEWTGDELAEAKRQARAESAAAPPVPPSAPAPRRRRAQKDALVDLVLEQGVELWNDGDEAFASFPVHGHRENDRIRGRRFRRFAARLFHEMTGSSPSSQALQDGLAVLEGKALFDGQQHEVHLRVAGDGVHEIQVDLGDDRWQVARITASGWTVMPMEGVRFIRPGGMRALAAPLPGGNLEALREFCNLADDDDWALYRAFIVGAYRPVPPGRPLSRPVLVISGEQGSSKSTIARLTRELTDPADPPSRSAPRDERDLAIAARNAWVLNFDNLSFLPEWLSDALSRLATGAGFACRTLYENDAESVFNAQRSIILNGIEELARRSDLLDRTVLLDVPPIPESKRLREDVYWSRVDQTRPYIVGAIFDALSATLAAYPVETTEALPRMADFAAWSLATEAGMGWPQGAFLAAYRENRKGANTAALEGDVVAEAIMRAPAFGPWEGTSTELRDALNARVTDDVRRSKQWPKTPRGMSGALRRIAPNLRASGLLVEFPERQRDRRLVRIGMQATVTTAATVTPSPPPRDDGDGRDGGDGRSPTYSTRPTEQKELEIW